MPERLATYENALSPIRYDAFRAISDHFFLNPQWLVSGSGCIVLDQPFDDREFKARIDGRSLLSAVYDGVLKAHFDAVEKSMVERWLGPTGLLSELGDFEDALRDSALQSKLPTYLLERVDKILSATKEVIRDVLLTRGFTEEKQTQIIAVPPQQKKV